MNVGADTSWLGPRGNAAKGGTGSRSLCGR